MSAAYTRVGRIVASHGLAGEVSVALSAPEYAEALVGLEVWVVPPPSVAPRRGRVSSVRTGPRGSLLLIDGIDSVEAARSLKGHHLLARSGSLPGVTSGPEPVVGFEVVDQTRGRVGHITGTIVTGANDVWVVDGPFGEVLIPVIDDVVEAIQTENRIVTVRLLEGLIDDGTPQ